MPPRSSLRDTGRLLGLLLQFHNYWARPVQRHRDRQARGQPSRFRGAVYGSRAAPCLWTHWSATFGELQGRSRHLYLYLDRQSLNDRLLRKEI